MSITDMLKRFGAVALAAFSAIYIAYNGSAPEQGVIDDISTKWDTFLANVAMLVAAVQLAWEKMFPSPAPPVVVEPPPMPTQRRA